MLFLGMVLVRLLFGDRGELFCALMEKDGILEEVSLLALLVAIAVIVVMVVLDDAVGSEVVVELVASRGTLDVL